MSYRNPGIIRDRTAEVYAQQSKDLTNIFINYFDKKGTRLALAAKEKKEEDKRWTLNANKIAASQNKINQETGEIINAIDGDVFKDYQSNIKILGGNSLVALNNNQIKTNLTLDERDNNDKISNIFTTYHKTSQDLMGKIQAELWEHYGQKDGEQGLSNHAIGIDWNYVGNNINEKLTNMFAINAFNNTDAASIYNGKMTKSGGYDEMGNSDVRVSTSIPIDNKDFLQFQPLYKRGNMTDTEWETHKEKHGIIEKDGKFIFDRILNNRNFGKGFVRKTMAGPSPEEMLEKPGLVSQKGNIPKEAFITNVLNSKESSKSTTKGNVTTTQKVSQRYFDNEFFIGKGAKNWQVALSKARAIVGQNDSQDIKDYLRNRLNLTEDVIAEDAMTDGLYDAEKIALLMQIDTQRTALASYESKKADKKDVKYYEEQGFKVDEGDLIYWQESNIRESEVTDKIDTSVLNETQLNTLQKRILDLQYPKTNEGKIDRSKLPSILNDKGWTVTVENYDDGSSEVFIRKSTGKTTSAIPIEEDITEDKLNRILAQLQGVSIEMSQQLFSNSDDDASGSQNFDPKALVADINSTMKEIQANK